MVLMGIGLVLSNTGSMTVSPYYTTKALPGGRTQLQRGYLIEQHR